MHTWTNTSILIKFTGYLYIDNLSVSTRLMFFLFQLTETENKLMDLSDLEKELFSKVETIDYYTTVMKIKGLDHLPIGFYYVAEFMDDPETIGNPVAIQRFYADTDIYLFWSYGNAVDIKGARVRELAIDAVDSLQGGTR